MGVITAISTADMLTSRLNLDLDGNAHESIGGHARRLAAEYGDGSECMAKAVYDVLNRDRNESSSHHRSGAISVMVKEMMKAKNGQQSVAAMYEQIITKFTEYYGSNSTWTSDLITYYALAAKNVFAVNTTTQAVLSSSSSSDTTTVPHPSSPTGDSTYGVSGSFASDDSAASPALASIGGNNKLIYGAVVVLVAGMLFSRRS